MSLVGNLEDLGLGDILQIITLSRKSGALCLRSDDREGRIVFQDGLVCCASVKGMTPDLRGLLVGEGVLDDEAFEAARATASERGAALADVLAEALEPGRFEGLRRECVERAVLEMFGWHAGDFSFEVGEEVPEDGFSVVLESGINAQYLAMEGTRRTDEGHREPEVDPGDVSSFADVAEEIGGDEPRAERDPAADAYEAVALSTAENVDRKAEMAAGEAERVGGEVAERAPRTEDAVEEAFAAAMVGPVGSASSEEVGEAVVEAAPESALPAPAVRPPVVVVDPQLPMLEWVKEVLEGVFPRIHIFQQAELAVERLRQYVTRGERPLVLVSPDLPIDGAHGWSDVDELVARMKKQSPRSRILWLGERGDVGAADGEVVRPPDPSVVHLSGNDPLVGESLKGALLAALGGAAPAQLASAVRPLTLPEVTARLSDPETRGEVLNVVLRFAAQHFRRVALFALRGRDAVGLAQIGLATADGPDDVALRQLHVRVDESRWLTRLVENRRAVCGPAEGDGDARLCAQLGGQLPAEAWIGPVVSDGQVVAFLYGDQLPDEQPVGKTAELEVALVGAGRALDAAVAERTRSDP